LGIFGSIETQVTHGPAAAPRTLQQPVSKRLTKLCFGARFLSGFLKEFLRFRRITGFERHMNQANAGAVNFSDDLSFTQV
jgi:hypothetical protein